MVDMYLDLERSIYMKLSQLKVITDTIDIALFTEQVTKSDYPNQHCAISITKISDVPTFDNSGGQGAVIRTPQVVNGQTASFSKQDWPDSYNLLYQLEVSADTVKDAAGNITVNGLDLVRYAENLIRQAFRPRRRLMVWDSTLNGGNGDWSPNSYVNYAYAGYINRDNPQEEIYNRITNIRFEVFDYQDPTAAVTEGVIKQVDVKNSVDNLTTVIE